MVAGFRYKVKFDMQKTTCAKADHKDLNELCIPDEQDSVNRYKAYGRSSYSIFIGLFLCVILCLQEFVKCNTTVDVAPWRLEPPEAQLDCEPGELPAVRPRFVTLLQHWSSTQFSALNTVIVTALVLRK